MRDQFWGLEAFVDIFFIVITSSFTLISRGSIINGSIKWDKLIGFRWWSVYLESQVY